MEAVGRGGWHWIGPVMGDTSTAAGDMQHIVCCIRLASSPIEQTRQAELSAAPLMESSTFPKAHSLRYN